MLVRLSVISWDMTTASRVTTRASYGTGRGRILLDNVNCNGLENGLGECDHNGWGVNNCIHREDAGVVCEGKLHLFMRI